MIWFRALVVLAGTVLSASGVPAAESDALQALLSAEHIDFETVDPLYRAAIERDGDIVETVDELERYARDPARSAHERAGALLAASHLQWRFGLREAAQESVAAALEIETNADTALQQAQLFEAAGELEQAQRWYEEALDRIRDPERKEEVRLRLTFLAVEQEDIDALVQLAATRDREFRNRAAVALAILGHPAKAIDLYEAYGEGSDRFRQHLRLAQWAYEAGDAPRAQEEAWQAVQTAALERDRRYALSVLVDAYELDDGLDRLLERLAGNQDLSEEEQSVRIDLLQRLGRHEEATRLFQEAGEESERATTPPAARRRLLRMYREAGRVDDMVAEYRRLSAAEPAVVEWPEGWSQHLIERGDRAGARAVWQAFLDRNDTAGELLAGAEAMARFGFDELAVAATEKILTVEPRATSAALLARFELYLRRGAMAKAEQTLSELDERLAPDAPDRIQLADAYERIEKPREALAVLEALDESRPGGVGIDERMRMAWLYDSTGARDKALAVWKGLWEDEASGASRRLVEDRLVTLAAETGALGDLVVELETKLAEGGASKKDSALLVRIYSDTGDSTSAVEVIQEYFGHGGRDATEDVEVLREQANVYRAVGRYRAFERVTNRLLELDPDNRVDYLQSLILNQLENGSAITEQEKEAQEEQLRAWLAALRQAGGGATGAEFEAGILELAGQIEAAITTYRRALAENPDHDDNYLLLADLLKQEGRAAEAIAALQYQIESAGEDDAFIVGVDGILNVQPDDTSVMAWAQRRTLERLTARHDKLYLYDLLSELAEGAGDTVAYFAALENSLAYANSRRSHVLRELIVATASSSNIAARLSGGVRESDVERNLRYSRRLISLDEKLPPEVYMDMGRTLLRMGDAESAATVFDRAVDSAGEASLVEETGDLFKNSGFSRQAMVQYEKVLIADTSNIGIMRKLADVRAQRGLLDEAHELYRRALLELLKTLPLEIEKSGLGAPPEFDGTVNYAYRRHYWRLLSGFLYTLPSDGSLSRIEQAFDEAPREVVGSETSPKELAYYPRLNALARLARQAALRSGRVALADELDGRLLRLLSDDQALRTELVEHRTAWGLPGSAAGLRATHASHGAPIAPSGAPRAATSAAASGSRALIPSRAAATRALQRGDHALAVHIALFLEDRKQALAAYRQWVSQRLQSAESVTGLLEEAYSRLDAASFASLSRYVFDLARGHDAYLKKLVLRRSSYWRPGATAPTSLLIEMERAAGRALLPARDVLAVITGSDGRELGMLDHEYAVSRLPPTMEVELVEHLLGDPQSTSPAMAVLADMLREPLGSNAAARLVEVLRTWTQTAGEQGAGRLANSLSRIASVAHGVDPANGALIAQLDRLLAEHAQADRLSSAFLTPGFLSAGLLRDTGQPEQALPVILDEFLRRYEVSASSPRDPRDRSTPRQREEARREYLIRFLDEWADLLYPHHRAEVLALAQAKEDELGLTPAVFALQDALHEIDSDVNATQRLKRLEELASRYPDGAPGSEPVLRSLAAAYARAGYADRQLRTLERLVRAAPRDLEYRRRLLHLWQQLGHPENALASTDGRLAEILSQDDGVEGPGPLEGNDWVYRQAPPARVAVEQITSLDHGGSEEQARAGLRMLWQMLQPDGASGQDLQQMSGGEADAGMLSYPNVFALDWRRPRSMTEDVDEARGTRDPELPSPTTLLQSIEAESEALDPFAREGKLLDELTAYGFSVEEFEAQIRTLAVGALDQQELFYELLAESYEAHRRVPGELERLTERVESGQAGRKERVLWMGLLGRAAPERVERLLPLAERMTAAQEGLSRYERILLARLHARAGHDTRAADLYTAVTLSIVSDGSVGNARPDKTAALLYGDAEHHLGSVGLDRYTAALLRIAWPNAEVISSPSENVSSLESACARFVLWLLKRNPDSRPAEEQLQLMLTGHAADDWSSDLSGRAAERLARVGRHERALQMLQQALRSNRERESGVERESQYAEYARHFLAVPSPDDSAAGRRRPQSAERPLPEELARLASVFPAPGDAWPGAPEWTQKATEALTDWIEQGRVERAVALPVLAVAILRRHQQGDVEAARAAAARMVTFLAPHEAAPRFAASWVVEVMREVGAPLDVPLLQGLIRHQRLAAYALAPTLERVARATGTEQAVALGEQALAYTQDEALLQVLKSLAADMDRADLVEQYSDVERRAEAARTALVQG